MRSNSKKTETDKTQNKNSLKTTSTMSGKHKDRLDNNMSIKRPLYLRTAGQRVIHMTTDGLVWFVVERKRLPKSRKPSITMYGCLCGAWEKRWNRRSSSHRSYPNAILMCGGRGFYVFSCQKSGINIRNVSWCPITVRETCSSWRERNREISWLVRSYNRLDYCCEGSERTTRKQSEYVQIYICTCFDATWCRWNGGL